MAFWNHFEKKHKSPGIWEELRNERHPEEVVHVKPHTRKPTHVKGHTRRIKRRF